MNIDFQLAIQKVTISNNQDELWDNAQLATRILGFEHCAYGHKQVLQISDPSLLMINTYPDEWNKIYINENFLVRDPVVNAGLISSEPILWDNVYKQDKEFWEMSSGYGLKYGWSKSFFSPSGFASLFSVCRSHESITKEEAFFKTPFLLWLSTVVIHRFTCKFQSSYGYHLTHREKEVIHWSANGKTSAEIAIILNLSERTVNWHIKNVIEKLGVSNKIGAVAKAIRLSII